MKKMTGRKRVTFLGTALVLIMTLISCSREPGSANGTFPNIDDDKIPDVLETTVGTLGNCYFSSGITDNPDYSSVLIVTFKDTAETDYTTLMEHYKSTSTGTGEDDSLLFDWGTLHVKTEDDSITINALIK